MLRVLGGLSFPVKGLEGSLGNTHRHTHTDTHTQTQTHTQTHTHTHTRAHSPPPARLAQEVPLSLGWLVGSQLHKAQLAVPQLCFLPQQTEGGSWLRRTTLQPLISRTTMGAGSKELPSSLVTPLSTPPLVDHPRSWIGMGTIKGAGVY